jgi:F0F1-type ATP synthase assembly protein I
MVVPVGVGWALDAWLDWRPWGIIVGAVLGLVVGLSHLVVLTNRANKKPPSGKEPPK